MEGLREQVLEDREGEEAAGQRGGHDQERDHVRRDRRRDGEGTEAVPAADVRGTPNENFCVCIIVY